MNWLATRWLRSRPAKPRRAVSCRRFTLLDGMIFVGVAAIGFTAYRAGMELYSEWYYTVQMSVDAFLLLMSSLVLIYRSRLPRPSIRQIARQPGTVACFAVLAMQLFQVSESLTTELIHGDTSSFTGVGGFLWSLLSASTPSAAAVVPISWLLLVAGRSWRPEAGWIDRLGRWVGWTWIAWLVAWPLFYWLSYQYDYFPGFQQVRMQFR